MSGPLPAIIAPPLWCISVVWLSGAICKAAEQEMRSFATVPQVEDDHPGGVVG